MSRTILIVLLMVFAGSTFGLTNIWPRTVVGAIMGTVLGFETDIGSQVLTNQHFKASANTHHPAELSLLSFNRKFSIPTIVSNNSL